ncbi:hypothetical protein FTX61_08445 [Nitriliruptoraceae bacterium ZYF776]|nr:hypothetical protein [Profundirhabdus halotolerans]
MHDERDEAVTALTGAAVGRRTVPPAGHREDVLRRLLALGLSPAALRRILPTWTGLIDRVAHPG